MQIRCASCGRAVTVAATGVLPERCPHCRGAPVPESLGKWRIERLLAAGGMGEVYLARHRELGSRVAIKLLPGFAGETEGLRERFAREATLTAAIEHPGVVQVLDYEDDGGRAFLVLEYLDGRNLRSLLRDGPLPWPRAVQIAVAVADILAAAHARGVVHRDIKPENVLVAADGRVRVLDFGIARALQDHEPLTRTGEILGTPEYMAPEQILEAPESVDARTDVHALGVLLYELLTGRSPFAGTNLFAALKLVESMDPEPPSTVRPDVPAAVDAVVRRALQKAPSERFDDAAAFAVALREVVGDDSPALPPRRARVTRGLLLSLVLAVVAFTVGRLFAPRATAPTTDSHASTDADARSRLRDLLARPDADAGALHAARAALAGADDEDALALRGRASLRLGAFHAALDDLDRARARGDRAVADDAAVAFVEANLLLPAVTGAPVWLSAVDRERRDRIFGDATAPGDDTAPAASDSVLVRACRLLAHGDAAHAFATLRPMDSVYGSGTPTPAADASGAPNGPEATVALLAACRACADRPLLRRLATELQPAHPDPGWQILVASLESPAALREALRAHAMRLDPGGSDRWLVEMFVAAADGRSGDGRVESLRGAAELAWLTGAGEPAPIWYAALRLGLAADDPSRFALSAERAAAIDRLIAPADAADHPAAAIARALLASAADDEAAAARALRALPAGDDPSLGAFTQWRDAVASGATAHAEVRGLWDGAAAWLVGRREDAATGLARLAQEPSAVSASAHLLLALLARDAGDATPHWRAALTGGADFGLLELVPYRDDVAAPPVSVFVEARAAGRGADVLVPAARACVRCGADPTALAAALAIDADESLRAAWTREVRGGIERR